MVAALQRLIVFALAAVALGAWSIGLNTGHEVAGIVVAVCLTASHAFILATEFICHAHVEKPNLRPMAASLALAWVEEVWVAARVFYWRQPFFSKLIPNQLPPAPNERRGLLLVHGLVCNRGFWNPWMFRLKKAGTPFVAVDLEPAFGSIEHYKTTIDRAVEDLTAATGASPVVVAHSMGGLAVRHWLQTSRPSAVHHVITIGTPHHGTWLARFAHSTNGRQMAVGSAWLEELNSSEAMNATQQMTCFYGNCDNIVFPALNACLQGADNRHIPRTAHVALAFREEVFAEAERWLKC